MPRIELKSLPFNFNLYCPFCGQQVVGGGDEGFVKECPHTVCLGPGDEREEDLLDTDIVFFTVDPAPIAPDHVFAFREPDEEM